MPTGDFDRCRRDLECTCYCNSCDSGHIMDRASYRLGHARSSLSDSSITRRDIDNLRFEVARLCRAIEDMDYRLRKAQEER